MTDEGPVQPGGGISDKYYIGTVVKLYAGSEGGVIRSATGREIPFKFAHLTIVGEPCRFGDLREGAVVGYDVCRTARGLCVSVLRLSEPG